MTLPVYLLMLSGLCAAAELPPHPRATTVHPRAATVLARAPQVLVMRQSRPAAIGGLLGLALRIAAEQALLAHERHVLRQQEALLDQPEPGWLPRRPLVTTSFVPDDGLVGSGEASGEGSIGAESFTTTRTDDNRPPRPAQLGTIWNQ